MGYSSGPRVGTEFHTGSVGTNAIFSGGFLRIDGAVGFTSGGSCLLAAGGTLSWTGRSGMKSPVDGQITLLNAAQTDFTRLQFGGTAATFPALVRSGALIDCQLADGSARAGFRAGQLIATLAAAADGANLSIGATTATTVGAAGGGSALPATPVGYIIIFVGATQMKIPYYNT